MIWPIRLSINKWEWLCIGNNDFNQFQFKCVRKCLELTQTTGFPKKPSPFRAVFEICKSARYKYLYLRFLRLPPCGILWICPHFDQNILISQHLSFYPINWFLDKSVFTRLYRLIEILLFESGSNEKCSHGIVGKNSLVKKRLGPGYPKS